MSGERVEVFKLVFELKRGKRQLLIRGGPPAWSSAGRLAEDGWGRENEARQQQQQHQQQPRPRPGNLL